MSNNKWQALSMKDRAFLIREAVRNGITNIDSIRDTWEHRFDGLRDVVEKVNTSNKDFAKRLRQEGRVSIPDWEDSKRIATHKLGVSTDENGIHYIFPSVQNINNQLIDFTNPNIKGSGYEDVIAAERGDTIQIGNTSRDLRNAIKFTKKYKKLGIYPEFSTPSHIFSGEDSAEPIQPPSYDFTYADPRAYSESLPLFETWIKSVENPTNKNYDPKTKRWTAYESAEKGAPTIGYGIKLDESNPEMTALYKKQGYIDDDVLQNYSRRKYLQALTNAAKTWNSYYATTEFAGLAPELQVLLADKVFQIGSVRSYPKFIKAIREEDWETMLKEGNVYYHVDGERRPTKDRNNKIAQYIYQFLEKLDHARVHGEDYEWWRSSKYNIHHTY